MDLINSSGEYKIEELNICSESLQRRSILHDLDKGACTHHLVCQMLACLADNGRAWCGN